MSRPCPVPGCDLDATEWTICRSCASRLARDLAAIPALVAQVEVTLTRQGATGGYGGSRAAVRPLAFDPRASLALGDLKAALVGRVRDLAEDDPDVVWPPDTAAGCATWLGERIAVLRTHPAAGEIAIEIVRATGACWRAIDRAPARWFAGPCDECGAPMYAEPGALRVRCPAVACRFDYDVAERRAQLLESARDYLLTIPEMMRALPEWTGRELNASTMWSWHHRGRMLPHGVSETGKDTFRIGDVLDLLLGTARGQSDRA